MLDALHKLGERYSYSGKAFNESVKAFYLHILRVHYTDVLLEVNQCGRLG